MAKSVFICLITLYKQYKNSFSVASTGCCVGSGGFNTTFRYLDSFLSLYSVFPVACDVSLNSEKEWRCHVGINIYSNAGFWANNAARATTAIRGKLIDSSGAFMEGRKAEKLHMNSPVLSVMIWAVCCRLGRGKESSTERMAVIPVCRWHLPITPGRKALDLMMCVYHVRIAALFQVWKMVLLKCHCICTTEDAEACAAGT